MSASDAKMPPIDGDPTRVLVAFEVGLAGRKDVAAWVDGAIAGRDEVRGALLELATLRDKDDITVAKLLRELRGASTQEGLRADVGALYELVRERRLALDAAALAAKTLLEEANDARALEVDGLLDLYWLAKDGAYGDIRDAARDLEMFLEHNA